MRFTLSGIGASTHAPVHLTWDDGRLSGDVSAVASVLAYAHAYDGKPVGAFGAPTTTTGHLASPTSAYTLMRLVFDEPPRIEGDLVLPVDDVTQGGDGNG